MRRKLLIAALMLDLVIGDPPNRWHPVAWMGSVIYRLRKQAPEQGKFIYGGMIAWGGGLIVWGLAWSILRLTNRLPAPLNWLVRAWLLKTPISLHGLNNAAHEVETALWEDDLTEARRLLSWHLVSRDTSQLDASQVAAAAIESVAENTSDGIIASLFWYGVGGVPAALTYRYLQTCDSILGYRDAEREWLGKISARTDDLLNLIPARVTALCIVMLRPRGWHVWRRDAHLTASPNAGHPMSAMAGAFDVELEKVNHYRLNPGARAPKTDDVRHARRLMFGAVGLFIMALIVTLRER
ncbi:MAG: cobalamin biosynthesis protein CobD [Chloroflexi bacterium]|nr:cobalamin biosynthesis protein CobD [Chloroflexota bacterium]